MKTWVKRRRRFALVALLGMVLVAARQLPLMALGAFLASGRPAASDQGFDFAYVLLGGGDGELELAARLVTSRPSCSIVLCESEPTRLVRFNVLPPSHEVDIARLEALGVPRDRIVLIPQDTQAPRWALDLFCRWHHDQGGPKTLVLCEELGQRSVRIQLGHYSTPEQLGTLYTHGLVNRYYPLDRWWHTRRGIKSVVLGYIDVFNSWYLGPTEPIPPDAWWDVDEYEQTLQASR